jgi:Acetyltransferase (GNAT) domain
MANPTRQGFLVSPSCELQSLSATQRSVLAEVMLQADRYGGSLETVRLSPRSDYGGSMYLFERRIRGWKTGIYDGMLILYPSHSLSDFCMQPKGLPEMLGKRSILTLRVFGSSLSENLSTTDGLLDLATSANVREVMTLAPDYKEFLRKLGKHTRRNIQQCRKWAWAKAIRVQCEPLNSADVLALAIKNMPTPKHPERILQNIRFTEKQAQPFQLSLITDGGAPFSTAGGFIEGNFAFLIYQANDHRYRQLNPSLMLRSFLIELLIERGVKHLAFVGGCAGVLLHQCEVVKTAELLLVRKTIFAGIKHFAAASLSDETSRIGRLSPQFV